MEIRNHIGEVIGRIERQGAVTYVYNKVGEVVGKCEGGLTYNQIGEVVAYSELPGMLISD